MTKAAFERFLYAVRTDAYGTVAIFDCIESAQLYADSNYGPWYPGSTWERLSTGADGSATWHRMLHCEEAPEVNYEGEEIKIDRAPAFLSIDRDA